MIAGQTHVSLRFRTHEVGHSEISFWQGEGDRSGDEVGDGDGVQRSRSLGGNAVSGNRYYSARLVVRNMTKSQPR